MTIFRKYLTSSDTFKAYHLTTILILFISSSLLAQQETEIRTDGIVVPRTTIIAVTTPVKGMMIYDTDDDLFKFYNGSEWNNIGGEVTSVSWEEITDIPVGFADDLDDVDDGDTSSTNEIQSLSITGNIIRLSSDAAVVNLKDIVPFKLLGNVIAPNTGQLDKDFVIGANSRFHLPINGLDSFYMYYDVSKSAYRGGMILNEQNWSEDSLGIASMAHGIDLIALGNASTALGKTNRAYGASSFVGGENSRAVGNHSFAFGRDTESHGNRGAMAVGDHVLSHGKASIAVGRFNDPVVSENQNVNEQSPMFIVGNGSQALRKNALLVRKDGHTGINTSIPSHTLTVQQDTCANAMTEGIALIDTVTNSEWVFNIDCDGNLVLYFNDTPITGIPPSDGPGGGWQPYPFVGDRGPLDKTKLVAGETANNKSVNEQLKELKIEMKALQDKLQLLLSLQKDD